MIFPTTFPGTRLAQEPKAQLKHFTGWCDLRAVRVANGADPWRDVLQIAPVRLLTSDESAVFLNVKTLPAIAAQFIELLLEFFRSRFGLREHARRGSARLHAAHLPGTIRSPYRRSFTSCLGLLMQFLQLVGHSEGMVGKAGLATCSVAGSGALY